MPAKWVIILSYFVLWGPLLFSQTPDKESKTSVLQLELEGASSYALDDYLYVLPDTIGNLTIEEVSDSGYQHLFSPAEKSEFNEFTPKIGYAWYRFSLSNEDLLAHHLLLNFSAPYFSLYSAKSNGGWEEHVSGYLLPHHQRPFQNLYREIPFTSVYLGPQSTRTYYVRIQHPKQVVIFPLFRTFNRVLIQPAAATDRLFKHHMITMLIMGITLMVAIYHFILYGYNLDRRFLNLALYSLALFAMTANYQGYIGGWLMPNHLPLYYRVVVRFIFLFSAATIISLLRSFGETKRRLPRWDRALKWIFRGHFVLLGSAALAGLSSDPGLEQLSSGITGIWFMYNLATNLSFVFLFYYAYKEGVKNAGIYLVAFIIPVLNVYLVIFDYFGFFEPLLGASMMELWHQDWGNTLHDLILAFGLAASFKTLQEEKLMAEMEQRKEQEKVVLELKKINSLKDQFLANTSHELRTPINGIIGLSESLLEDLPDPTQKQDLALITSSGKRLATLVNDLLDFSKLKHFDIKLQQKNLDLGSLVEVILRLNQPLASDKSLKLINSVPRDYQPVLADENRLQQILHNLVGNAIKFTQSGQVEVTVEDAGEMVKLMVSDTGIGIPTEKQSLIFEEFQQADGSISREFGGTGLGLTISQNLVKLHGGEMGLDSVVNEGSTFWFTLPKASGKASKQELIYSESEASLSRLSPVVTDTPNLAISNPDEVRILIVDDEPINQRVLGNHLSKENFQLVFASDGIEALEILRLQPKFDLILLDLMMPKMSGYEVCEKIREEFLPSELPIIMVTAKNQVGDMVQGLNRGANDFIAKPFSKQEFLARVKTHLDLHNIFDITGRFIPNEFIRSLGRERITDLKLGDQVEKEVSVLFTDIRNYTSLAENMSPEDNFRFINAYTGRMGPIIQYFNGFVNQYLGDGIMAIFQNESENALDAAIGMQVEIQTYNLQRLAYRRPLLSVGMGIHSGPLVMGIIGDKKRTDAATISDSVNTASRMEGLTKTFGARILLSDASFNRLSKPERFHFRYLGTVKVKGRAEMVGVYECYDGDPDEEMEKKSLSLSAFNQAVSHFSAKEFSEAVDLFNAILANHPEDKVANYFLQEAQKNLSKENQ